MSCRVHQLKLHFCNKIKLLPQDLYVRRIFEYFWTTGSAVGLVGELRDILGLYRLDPELGPALRQFHLMDHAHLKIQLKKITTHAFQRIDFRMARRAVIQSAALSTGQAEGIRRVTFTVDRHRGVLSQLANPLLSAPERTIYHQVLIGCDFLTPFSYRNKPKCLFCGAKGITMKHLVLECPRVSNLGDGTGTLILERILTTTSCPPQIQSILATYSAAEMKDNLFWCVMGVWDLPLLKKFRNYNYLMTKITANRLLELKRSWIEAAARVPS